MVGAGNGSGRWKRRQRWGQTTINQRAAAIAAVEAAIVVATKTWAVGAAALVAMVAPTVAEAAQTAAKAVADAVAEGST
jgi:hypothetical protein